MDKFYWKENEAVIVKSQCDLCELQTPKCKESCIKYVIKPSEVLSNAIKCPCFSRKGRIKL